MSFTGGGITGNDSEQADTTVQSKISEAEPENMEAQTEMDTDQIKADAQEQGKGTDSVMREYSDREKNVWQN